MNGGILDKRLCRLVALEDSGATSRTVVLRFVLLPLPLDMHLKNNLFNLLKMRRDSKLDTKSGNAGNEIGIEAVPGRLRK